MTDDTFRSQPQDAQEPSSVLPEPPEFYSQIRPHSPPVQYQEGVDLVEMLGATWDMFPVSTLWRDTTRLARGGMERRDEAWDSSDDTRLRELFEEYNIPITPQSVREHRNTINEGHARRVLQRTQQEIENQRKISAFYDNSTAEFLGTLGLSMFDPVGWVAGGVAGKLANTGLRARRAQQIAQQGMETTMLTPVVSRGEYAMRNALAAAAADGTLEAYHISRSPTAGNEEMIIAGIGSLAVGGVFGALNFKGADRAITERAVRRSLQEQFDALQLFDSGDGVVPPSPAPRSSDPFRNSSVGASRPDETASAADAPSTPVDPLVEEFDPGENSTFAGGLRFDAFSHFGRSSNPFIRALNSIMLVDGAASNAGKGRVQHFTVEEIAHQHERVFSGRFANEVTAAWDSWKKSQGISTRDSAFNADHYNEFMGLVARAVRGDPTVNLTPEIIQVRDAFRKSMREQLEAAQRAGILEDVDVNDLYIPRFWRRDAFLRIMERHGDKGEDVLAVMIGRGLRNARPDMELEVADSIARHVIRVVTDPSIAQEGLDQISNMSRKKARERLIGLLGEQDDEVLDSLVNIFGGRQRQRAEDGPRAESRLDLDENAEVMLGGERYRLDSLLNNDLLSINTIYSRQIGGRIGFSDVTAGKLKTTDDIEAFLQKAKNANARLPNAELKLEQARVEQLKAYADYLLGHGSLGDVAWSENTQRFMKFLRDVSFARLMGQVGYAQLSEIGTAVGVVGMRAYLSAAPAAVRRVLQNYRPGVSQSDDHLIEVLADMTGLGNMHIQARMRTLSRELDSDDVYGARDTAPGSRTEGHSGQTAWDKATRGAELWARGTSIIGGLQPITDFAQYAMAQAFIASMARNRRAGRHLLQRKKKHTTSETRRLAMGIDDEWNERLGELFDEIAVYDDNGILKDLRITESADQEAVDYLFRVVLRESRRVIQEGDLGTSRDWMVAPLWRTILQFRTFVMNAHVKQMLYGANVRDAQLGTEFFASTVMAGIGQIAKYNLMTLGMGASDRSDYMDYVYGEDDERIANMIASSLRYSSHIGLLPDAIDMVTQMALGERYFDYRNTGLSSGFFDPEGSASLNTLVSPLRVIEELSNGEPDDAVRDFMRIGPNYTPLLILSNVLQGMAPDSMVTDEAPRASRREERPRQEASSAPRAPTSRSETLMRQYREASPGMSRSDHSALVDWMLNDRANDGVAIDARQIDVDNLDRSTRRQVEQLLEEQSQ